MVIINAVIGRYGPVTVLEETPEPNTLLFRRRLKKFGAVEVGGQLAFGMLQRALRLTTRRRLAEIVATHRFVSSPSDDCTIIAVGSVNSETCRRELARLETSCS